MSVNRLLDRELDIQIVASTHSPMVLASMETDFSSNSDMLHHLALKGSQVSLDTLEFYKCGDISAWLTSPAFGLRHARSREAESAIEAAKTVQSKADPQGEEVERVSRLLRWSLASDDPFWPRWIYFAERFGVEP